MKLKRHSRNKNGIAFIQKARSAKIIYVSCYCIHVLLTYYSCGFTVSKQTNKIAVFVLHFYAMQVHVVILNGKSGFIRKINQSYVDNFHFGQTQVKRQLTLGFYVHFLTCNLWSFGTKVLVLTIVMARKDQRS